jgi:hypothetical protein
VTARSDGHAVTPLTSADRMRRAQSGRAVNVRPMIAARDGLPRIAHRLDRTGSTGDP